MIFNSQVFVVFLIITFALYWISVTKTRYQQNTVLLTASYVFYGWWDYRFLSLIIFSSLVDYIIGNLIYNEVASKRRKTYLGISLLTNLGLLFVFKYFNFFVDSFLTAFSVEYSEPLFKLILPVGISFYTFQTLSYTIDIYRKQLKPSKDFIDFFAFVSFFPQLVAGPIERATHFLPQIQQKRVFSYPNAVLGCRYILYGFFKKVVIADNLAEIVNFIFAPDVPYSGGLNVMGMVLFALQIYCDFSGYSSIAIGVGKLFNINLMENFRRPYFAKSLTEFWSRWHISLSTWFRDYLYIPLGGSRVSSIFTVRNLFITFLISGLWHGANWTFIIWGAIHGAFLVFERFVLSKLNIHRLLGFFITMIIVMLAWVFFRAESLEHAQHYLTAMLDWNVGTLEQLNAMINSHSELSLGHVAIVAVILFGFLLLEVIIETGKLNRFFNNHKAIRITAYVVMIHIIFLFGSFRNAAEFIYFQF